MFWSITRLIAMFLAGGYGFLPDRFKSERLKLVALIIFLIAVGSAAVELYQRFIPRSTAYVTKDGTVLKSKNFRWKIQPSPDSDGHPVFVIFDRWGDASAVTVVPDTPTSNEVYNTMTGIGIRFLCPKDAVPNFEIKIWN
jgi:hypothetical protein